MAALFVGEKCSCTLSTLRFFTSSRLALEQNFSFLDGHELVCALNRKFLMQRNGNVIYTSAC